VAQSLGQELNLRGSNSGRFIFTNAPNGLHHLHEVLLKGDAHGQVGVVVEPLFPSHAAILVALNALKRVKEVFKNLFASLLTLLEVFVLSHVVDSADVSCGHVS